MKPEKHGPPDALEEELTARLTVRQPLDATPFWRDDILARAAEASVVRRLPPRWLAYSWAAAWVAILGLRLATPGDESPPKLAGALAVGRVDKDDRAPPWIASPHTLLALTRQLERNEELP